MRVGVLLLLPFFLIRFGLLSLMNRAAIKRAAYFAPLRGKEKAAYWIYQSSTIAVVAVLFFRRIQFMPAWWFAVGLGVYLVGLVLLAVSVVHFAAPDEHGFNQRGLYRFSRNPMYVAYFIVFCGCALMTRSVLLFALTVVFQISAHWIIRSEERWCIGQFGIAYLDYMQRVRRYF